MDGIKRLEYRGYNFSGIAFIEDGALKYEKTVGRIAELEKKLLGNNFHLLELSPVKIRKQICGINYVLSSVED